jgi:uncharacterized protein YjcR
MTKAIEVDWDGIKIAYIEGASYEELSDSYGVNISTLRNRGSRGKWTEERDSVRLQAIERAKAAMLESRAEQLIKFDDDILKMTKVIINRCAVIIKKKDEKIAPNDLSNIMNTVRNAQHVGRLALGATTENRGVSSPNGGPVQYSEVKDLNDLTDEQLMKIINGQ